MADMNFHGTVRSDHIYTEGELCKILNLSVGQMIEHYRCGLRYCQRSRKEPRLIPGDEYHRYVSRNLRTWTDEED